MKREAVDRMSVKKLTCYGVLIVCICLLLSSMGCNGGVEVGSGPEVTGSSTLETREMDYSDFSKVEAGYGFQVDITQANTFSVSITLNENLFEYLNIKIKDDDTLYIGLELNHTYQKIKHSATIAMPKLAGLTFISGAEGKVSGFSSTEPLNIYVSGASTLDFKDMETGDTEFFIMTSSTVTGSIKIANGVFKISASSDVILAGSAEDIDIDVKMSYLTLKNFTVANASVSIDAGGNVTLNVSGRLEGRVAGRSRLYYRGNPTLVDIDKVGGAIVEEQ